MKTRTIFYVCSFVMILALLLSGCATAPGDAATAPSPTATPASPVGEPAAPAEPGAPGDWQTFSDNVYGFNLAYPAGWQYKVQDMSGSGMPDDWPVKAAVSFFPESLAEAMNRQGPPDPNAPPAIPPFSVEVFVGATEEFRRAYPEPGLIEEEREINGASVVVERDTYEDFNTVRYVYTHPTAPNVRVVLLDVISGFTDRAAANPEYLDVIARVVASLEFIGAPSPAAEVAYTPVTLPEAGLIVELPVDWRPVAGDMAWTPTEKEWPCVGVNWVALQPAQEVEPALLPNHALVVDSRDVTLGWGTGRSYMVEVYAPAAQGGNGAAEVESVEWHTIIIAAQDGNRRAYDLYARGQDVNQLDSIMPVYEQLLNSSVLAMLPANPLDAIRFAVAAQLNADPNTLDLLLQVAEFPDGCLGMPAEGEICAQVLTPGYGGQVKVGDKVYEVRASQDGQRVIVCDGPACTK